jgi:nitrogen-specific signal transduction histidine kinase
MTTAQPDRLDRIEALLDRMAIESERSKRQSDERMSRLEDRMEELAQSQQATSRDVAQLVTILNRRSYPAIIGKFTPFFTPLSC